MYGNTPSNLWKLYTPQFREQKNRGPDEPITEAANKFQSVFCGGVYVAKYTLRGVKCRRLA